MIPGKQQCAQKQYVFLKHEQLEVPGPEAPVSSLCSGEQLTRLGVRLSPGGGRRPGTVLAQGAPCRPPAREPLHPERHPCCFPSWGEGYLIPFLRYNIHIVKGTNLKVCHRRNFSISFCIRIHPGQDAYCLQPEKPAGACRGQHPNPGKHCSDLVIADSCCRVL